VTGPGIDAADEMLALLAAAEDERAARADASLEDDEDAPESGAWEEEAEDGDEDM
jgi:hypothetical protein